METKSKSVSLSSVYVKKGHVGRGNLVKIHRGGHNYSSAVKRQFDVYANGTDTKDKWTSKLMRLEVLLSKMVCNSFWRSILLKEFLGRSIAPLILLQLQGTVMTTLTPRTMSIKKLIYILPQISRYSEFILFVFLSLETEYETQSKMRKLSVGVHSLHTTLNLI